LLDWVSHGHGNQHLILGKGRFSSFCHNLQTGSMPIPTSHPIFMGDFSLYESTFFNEIRFWGWKPTWKFMENFSFYLPTVWYRLVFLWCWIRAESTLSKTDYITEEICRLCKV